ncbi:CAAX prenyl protease-like protein [Geodermatophilus tzadiensis]|uniref:CAAX prenyl protease-like protein n=1 Tax=Geodermatophilus tzadiensis TaxID=1137988 RepID=A0A2T0TC93_9ACTN|nr:CPBP family intramembrane glutamic endopeptidase [Geodermatophilus tzadiensis]PRY43258.1 CAAX prenyl protease-like protein [Geodermatophilus tzadiensis]
MSAIEHTPAPPPRAAAGTRGLRARAARRPVTTLLAVTLPLGWALLAVPALAFHGVVPGGPLPMEPFVLALTLLVMLPTVLWVTAAADGRAGVRALLARAFRWRFGVGQWIAVLLALPVTTLAVGAALGRSITAADLPSVLGGAVVDLVVAVVVINLWEETVWAGFVQTRLEHRHGLVVAAVLTALAFGGIHLPMLLAAEVTASGLLGAVAYLLLAAVLVRLAVGVFLRLTAGSVLAVAVLHAAFNASSGEGDVVDELLSGGQPVFPAVLAVVLVTAVAAALLARRQPAAHE